MSSIHTCRMSVTRAMQPAITAAEGRQPPGKIWVLAKLLAAFSTS